MKKLSGLSIWPVCIEHPRNPRYLQVLEIPNQIRPSLCLREHSEGREVQITHRLLVQSAGVCRCRGSLEQLCRHIGRTVRRFLSHGIQKMLLFPVTNPRPLGEPFWGNFKHLMLSSGVAPLMNRRNQNSKYWHFHMHAC